MAHGPSLIGLFVIFHLGSCATGPQSQPDRAVPPASSAASGGDSAPNTGDPPTHDASRSIMVIGHESISAGAIEERLVEAAGGQIIEEFVLEAALRRALEDAGRSVTDADVRQEQELLHRALNDDEDVAIRLLAELRRREGLGPRRLRALLWRNAALRALVQDDVELAEAAIERVYRISHGPRRRGRLILTPSLQEARAALNDLDRGMPFGDVASMRSIDASRDRGGLLDAVAEEDPAWPLAVRQSLFSLQPGEVSTPLLVNDRFAIVTFIEELPPTGVSFEAARPELLEAMRLGRERVQMGELTQRLLDRTTVHVLDPAYLSQWELRQQAWQR